MSITRRPSAQQRPSMDPRDHNSKQKSLIQQGFTLVELMIVIVIVGVLSAVALPNFLSQTSKAKATECTTKARSILSQVAAEALSSETNANSLGTSLATSETASSDVCTLTYTAIASNIATVDAVGKGDLASKYDGNFCVNVSNGKSDAQTATGTSPTATAASCT